MPPPPSNAVDPEDADVFHAEYHPAQFQASTSIPGRPFARPVRNMAPAPAPFNYLASQISPTTPTPPSTRYHQNYPPRTPKYTAPPPHTSPFFATPVSRPHAGSPQSSPWRDDESQFTTSVRNEYHAASNGRRAAALQAPGRAYTGNQPNLSDSPIRLFHTPSKRRYNANPEPADAEAVLIQAAELRCPEQFLPPGLDNDVGYHPPPPPARNAQFAPELDEDLDERRLFEEVDVGVGVGSVGGGREEDSGPSMTPTGARIGDNGSLGR